MPLGLRRGTVTAVLESHDGLLRLEVDDVSCVAYPRLTGPVEVGDDVLVNEQARLLGLGSGGFDVLYANLTRGLGLPAEEGAHVMKLPYTPGQFATRHAEEGSVLSDDLSGMPVVCCSLHSQLAPVCAALAGRRVAYVQVAGGALPLALSDSVRVLRERGLLGAAVGAGPCFGGDADCVNVWSALSWVKANGYEVVVCAIGPGIAGTGTSLGHGGMAAAEASYAAVGLGGIAILALRASSADARERHRGISHHTSAMLGLDGPGVRYAWPLGAQVDGDLDGAVFEGADVVDVSDWRQASAGLSLSHMGRGPDDDPTFFAFAFAAGRLAGSLA